MDEGESLQMATTDRILIIDDEPQLREGVQTYLEDSGFEVLQAADGAEGLAIFREQKPDCVLTDLQMPTTSGMRVLETVHDESPDTPIIVISGQGVIQDAIQALRLGAWDYLLKPVQDMAVLEHAVCRALERSRLIQDNRRYREEIERTNAKLQKTLSILEEDLNAGRSVQAKLSPPEQAQFGEYLLNFKIEPSLYLSGDFVDYFNIAEDYLIFYVADVSGHGASSAFVTVLLKSITHQILDRYLTKKEETILQPKQVLAEIASQVHSLKLGKYLTAVYGVLNLKTHELTYSIGGHFPNPVFGNEEMSFLTGKGFPVGIMAKASFDEWHIPFPPKHRLTIFSDGILELMNDLELPDKEKKLLSSVNLSSNLEALIETLKVRSQENLPDDVTLFALARS